MASTRRMREYAMRTQTELQNRRAAALSLPSTGAQREHAPGIPAHRHEIPFAFDVVEPAQQERAEPHHRVDDAEEGLRRLAAQRVELSTPGVFSRYAIWRITLAESGGGVLGAAAKRSRRRRRWRSRPSAISGAIFEPAPCSTWVWLRYPLSASARLTRPPLFRQRLELPDHRYPLLFVVRGLGHVVGHHEQAARGHRGLSVVALIEAPARDLHDARVLVRQVDLFLVLNAPAGRGRWTAARLATAAARLLGTRGELGLIVGLILLLHPRFDLAPRLGNRRPARLPALKLLGDRHAIGDSGGIRLLGELQQRLPLPLELPLELLRVAVGERAVAARVGVDLGPIHSAQARA